MISNLEALIALIDAGTMQRAAHVLHVTQSAVSKRIAELERRLDRRLIEPRGRKVVLTTEGLRLVAGARPLIEELRALVSTPESADKGHVTVEVSGSVLISWGAAALARAMRELKTITVDVRTNHASVAVERVRSGMSMVAIAQGRSTIAPDLSYLPLYEENLVIIPSRLKRFSWPTRGALPVLAIEGHTEAWHFTKRAMREVAWGFNLQVVGELQSFSAIVQMARAGFGHGLAPEEVARAFGIPSRALMRLPAPGLAIPVSLIGRKTTLGLPLVQRLYHALRAH